MVAMQNPTDLAVDKSALCTFCEMAVFWVQAEVKKQRAKEGVFKYVNEVTVFWYSFRENIIYFVCSSYIISTLFMLQAGATSDNSSTASFEAVREAPKS